MLKSKIQKPNIINYDGHNNYKYFYHYDIETNDAAQSFYEKVFIQELQHAAIITDSDLNEIDRIDQFCKPLPYKQVSPAAIKINNLSDKLDCSNTHYEMIKNISSFHKNYTDKGKVLSLGWNSNKFDGPIHISNLFQNLFPPHQLNTGGNDHCDAMSMAISSINFVPHYPFPKTKKGNPAYNLNDTASVFGINNLKAHDALSDVETLIKVIDNFQKFCPEIYESSLINASKNGTEAILRQGPCLLGEAEFGKQKITPLAHIVSDNDYSVSFDLRRAPEILNKYTDEQILKRISFKYSDDSFLRVIKKNITHALVSVSIIDNPDELLFSKFKLSSQTFIDRYNFINSDLKLLGRLMRLGQKATKDFKNSFDSDILPTSEENIYKLGFISDKDKKLCEDFHKLPWRKRWDIIKLFDDVRLVDFARRLCCEHDPQGASKDNFDWWLHFNGERLKDPNSGISTEQALSSSEKILNASLSKNERYQVEKTKQFILRHSNDRRVISYEK